MSLLEWDPKDRLEFVLHHLVLGVLSTLNHVVAITTQICNMQGTAQALLLQFHHPRSFLPSLLHFNLTQSCPLAAKTRRIVPQVGRLRSSRSGRRSRPTNTRFYINKFGGSALFTSFCSLQGAAAMEQQQVLADTDDVSHLSHIFEPIKGGDRDILMVFVPGGQKASESYFRLVSEIQAQLSLRLWVVVLYNTEQDLTTSGKIEGSLPGLLHRLQEKGFRPGSFEIENIFFAGHSLGAWDGRPVALRKAQGFIQLGSWFDPEQDALAEYPKPVLTLAGDLDGQATVGTSANQASEILDTEPNLGEYNTYAVKPVVIIPKMNHGNFADGKVNYALGDLDADISYDASVRRTAELIAAFLSVQVEGPKSDVGQWGFSMLKETVKETQGRYRAFWEALHNQAAEAVTIQLHVASLPKLKKENVRVIPHKFVNNFVVSKPWIASDENLVFVDVYLSKYGRKGLSNLWIKCKSREALMDVFGPDDTITNSTYELLAVGKDLNAKVFDMALSLVPEDARVRYHERGRKLRFIDDRIVKGPATEWIESDLGFSIVKDGELEIVEVQTPVLMSPTHGIIARFAGMHYMKLLTLARAMQWIIVDCLRRDSSYLTVYRNPFELALQS